MGEPLTAGEIRKRGLILTDAKNKCSLRKINIISEMIEQESRRLYKKEKPKNSGIDKVVSESTSKSDAINCCPTIKDWNIVQNGRGYVLGMTNGEGVEIDSSLQKGKLAQVNYILFQNRMKIQHHLHIVTPPKKTTKEILVNYTFTHKGTKCKHTMIAENINRNQVKILSSDIDSHVTTTFKIDSAGNIIGSKKIYEKNSNLIKEKIKFLNFQLNDYLMRDDTNRNLKALYQEEVSRSVSKISAKARLDTEKDRLKSASEGNKDTISKNIKKYKEYFDEVPESKFETRIEDTEGDIPKNKFEIMKKSLPLINTGCIDTAKILKSKAIERQIKILEDRDFLEKEYQEKATEITKEIKKIESSIGSNEDVEKKLKELEENIQQNQLDLGIDKALAVAQSKSIGKTIGGYKVTSIKVGAANAANRKSTSDLNRDKKEYNDLVKKIEERDNLLRDFVELDYGRRDSLPTLIKRLFGSYSGGEAINVRPTGIGSCMKTPVAIIYTHTPVIYEIKGFAVTYAFGSEKTTTTTVDNKTTYSETEGQKHRGLTVEGSFKAILGDEVITFSAGGKIKTTTSTITSKTEQALADGSKTVNLPVSIPKTLKPLEAIAQLLPNKHRNTTVDDSWELKFGFRVADNNREEIDKKGDYRLTHKIEEIRSVTIFAKGDLKVDILGRLLKIASRFVAAKPFIWLLNKAKKDGYVGINLEVKGKLDYGIKFKVDDTVESNFTAGVTVSLNGFAKVEGYLLVAEITTQAEFSAETGFSAEKNDTGWIFTFNGLVFTTLAYIEVKIKKDTKGDGEGNKGKGKKPQTETAKADWAKDEETKFENTSKVIMKKEGKSEWVILEKQSFTKKFDKKPLDKKQIKERYQELITTGLF